MQAHMLSVLSNLAAQIYARTGLNPSELGGEAVMTIFGRLNDRFCDRLGLAPSDIRDAHGRTVKAVYPLLSPPAETRSKMH